jgi:hypothetical protein
MSKARSRRCDAGKERHWQEVIRAQGRSGQSVRAFCRQAGVKEAAFYWWRRELVRRSEAEKGAGVGNRRAPASGTQKAGTGTQRSGSGNQKSGPGSRNLSRPRGGRKPARSSPGRGPARRAASKPVRGRGQSRPAKRAAASGRAAARGGEGSRGRSRDGEGSPFVPIHVLSDGPAVSDGPATGMEIHLGGGRVICVRPGFDRQVLLDVLAVLSAGPSAVSAGPSAVSAGPSAAWEGQSC